MASLLNSCTPDLTHGEAVQVRKVVSAWVNMMNQGRYAPGYKNNDPWKYQTNPVLFLGKSVSPPKTKDIWGDTLYMQYFLEFRFDSTGMSIEPAGKEQIKVTLSLRVQIRRDTSQVELTPATLILTRSQDPKITEVKTDLLSPARLLTENLEFFDPNGRVNLDYLEYLSLNLNGHFKNFAFSARVNGNNLLYVTDQRSGTIDPWHNKWEFHGKMGLADAKGTILLPVRYDLIYSFGTLVKGHAEIRLNDKFGLVNSNGEIILPPVFDLLIPPQNSEQWIMFKKGNQFGSIDHQGRVKLGETPPLLHEILENYISAPCDMLDEDFPELKLHPLDEMDGPGFWGNYWMPPAMFQKAGIMPSPVPMSSLGRFKPVVQEDIKLVDKFSWGEGIQGIISVFRTWIFAPRYAYNEERYTLSTHDQNLNLISSVELMRPQQEMNPSIFCNEGYLQWLGKDTLEVRLTVRENLFKSIETPAFRYFVVQPDGKIRALESRRKYPFTQFARLNEGYFKRCFCTPIPYEKRKIGLFGLPEADVEITHHYSAGEVEEMMCEIMVHRDTSGSLSPTDQANLAFLQSYLPKVRLNEASYLDREFAQEYSY
ncbi:MAG: WG repeat-containing protein [Bacteroidia bacterium]|nr:WG repeat-containing protein [Bacteroidia bacterium]